MLFPGEKLEREDGALGDPEVIETEYITEGSLGLSDLAKHTVRSKKPRVGDGSAAGST